MVETSVFFDRAEDTVSYGPGGAERVCISDRPHDRVWTLLHWPKQRIGSEELTLGLRSRGQSRNRMRESRALRQSGEVLVGCT